MLPKLEPDTYSVADGDVGNNDADCDDDGGDDGFRGLGFRDDDCEVDEKVDGHDDF